MFKKVGRLIAEALFFAIAIESAFLGVVTAYNDRAICLHAGEIHSIVLSNFSISALGYIVECLPWELVFLNTLTLGLPLILLGLFFAIVVKSWQKNHLESKA